MSPSPSVARAPYPMSEHAHTTSGTRHSGTQLSPVPWSKPWAWPSIRIPKRARRGGPRAGTEQGAARAGLRRRPQSQDLGPTTLAPGTAEDQCGAMLRTCRSRPSP
eukprot:542313-Alexandrium_andersonii.AAC.1